MVLGKAARERRSGRRSGERERGVSLVEYALGISLIVVASLGAITNLTDRAGENLRDHGASAGAPDLPDLGISTTTATTAGSGPGGSTTTTAPVVSADATILRTNVTGRSNQPWSPSVNILVTDSSSGTGLAGATITVEWTHSPSGTVVTQSFTTTSSGRANFGLTNLVGDPAATDYVSGVDFEVVSIVGSNSTIEYAPSAPLTFSFTDPT